MVIFGPFLAFFGLFDPFLGILGPSSPKKGGGPPPKIRDFRGGDPPHFCLKWGGYPPGFGVLKMAIFPIFEVLPDLRFDDVTYFRKYG